MGVSLLSIPPRTSPKGILAHYFPDEGLEEPVLLDGTIRPSDPDGTNTNRLTGEQHERKGRDGWCYDFSTISPASRVSPDFGGISNVTYLEVYLKAASVGTANTTSESFLRFATQEWLRVGTSGEIILHTNGTEYSGSTDLRNDFHYIQVYFDEGSKTVTIYVDGNLELEEVTVNGSYSIIHFGTVATGTTNSFSGKAYGLKANCTTSVSVAQQVRSWYFQEESGTISYCDDGLSHMTNYSITHSQDDDVTYSDANDRGYAGAGGLDLLSFSSVLTKAASQITINGLEVIFGAGTPVTATVDTTFFEGSPTFSMTQGDSFTIKIRVTDYVSGDLTVIAGKTNGIGVFGITDVGDYEFTAVYGVSGGGTYDAGTITIYTNSSLSFEGTIELLEISYNNVVPLLQDGVTPANSNITTAQYLGEYKPKLKLEGSKCLELSTTAVNVLAFSNLSSVVSITYETDSGVFSISGNNIVTDTSGKIYNLKLWSGAAGTGTLLGWLPIIEGSGVTVYDVLKNGYNATLQGSPLDGTEWDATQDTFHFIQKFGATIQGGVNVPAEMEDETTPLKIDVLGNTIPSAHLSGRILREGFGNVINLNPEGLPNLIQRGVTRDLTRAIQSENSHWLQNRDEASGVFNNYVLNDDRSKDQPCLTFDGVSTYIDLSSKVTLNVGERLSFYCLGSVLTGTLIPFSDQVDAQRNIRFNRNDNTVGVSLESASPNVFQFSNIPSNFKLIFDFISATEGETTLIDLDTGLSETVNNSSMITSPANATFDRIGAANGGALNKVDGQLFGFQITPINSNKILWGFPMNEGAGSLIHEVVGSATGTIQGFSGTEWNPANYQDIYDFGGDNGEELNGGVYYPGLLDSNGKPTGKSSRNGTSNIDNVESVKRQLNVKALVKKSYKD